ncbi:MAG: hypothetical protein ABEJ40_02725, partial [Haloarculaceae archaeon]
GNATAGNATAGNATGTGESAEGSGTEGGSGNTSESVRPPSPVRSLAETAAPLALPALGLTAVRRLD